MLQKTAKKTADGDSEDDDGRKDDFAALLEAIRLEIQSIDDAKADLSAENLAQQIDNLLKNSFFDLTARHEEFAALLGFSKYAGIWDGVASAERLLSRAWSMATDGHLEEAIEEIPRARAQIERACAAMAES